MFKTIGALAATAIALNFTLSANAKQQNYLCVPDMSTGFKLESGKWNFARFDVSKDKYLVQPDGDTTNYKVVTVGSATASHPKCSFDGLVISCGGLGYSFVMNTDALRFQQVYGIGYVHGDLPGNTPWLAIGRCSQL